MSFLAPLYLLGALAVGLPLLFHLVRRTPQGQQEFSSLMFLSPSPPRMSRRSRIEDWLLLFLRGLAVCLLALAFARPFLRAQSSISAEPVTRERAVVLLDTSASMRAEGLWERAQQRAQAVIEELADSEAVSLELFDQQSRQVMGFEQWQSLPAADRVETAKRLIQETAPGWQATRLGDALIHAAERLQDDPQETIDRRTIFVISDLQTGCGWESLKGFHWPEEVHVKLLPVRAEQQANASLHRIQEPDGNGETLSLRISNSPDSDRELFRIDWADRPQEEGETHAAADPQTTDGEAAAFRRISVPPGESRVVSLPVPAGDSPLRIRLSGDDLTFDNTCDIVPLQQRKLSVLSLPAGPNDNDPESPRFFLDAVFSDRPRWKVEILDGTESGLPADLSAEAVSLAIVCGSLNSLQQETIRQLLHQGGQVLFVARDAGQASQLYDLLSLPAQEVQEVQPSTFSLWERLDLSHPILQPFDDPRFADFTRLRFWRHRAYDPESLPEAKFLAVFADGSPAFAEILVGQGKLFLMSSSWSRDDSTLAVSSKFVPLMNGLLEHAAGLVEAPRQAVVGDGLDLSELATGEHRIAIDDGSRNWTMTTAEQFRFDRQGVYRFAVLSEGEGSLVRSIAVNLAASESRTELLDTELIAATGVPLDAAGSAAAGAEQLKAFRQRQLQNRELEAQQRWWQWLIGAVLAVLVVETVLAALRPVARPA